MSTKTNIDSDRMSPGSPNPKIMTAYTDDDLDQFQRELTKKKIRAIWKNMREGGNSKDGIVTRDKFRLIFLEHFREINIKEALINDIFERFRKRDHIKDERYDKRRNDEKRVVNYENSDKAEIDLHDLVVSLAVLSTLPYDEKLELAFDLTDIDEDGCLSPDDVCKMILAIERNFAKESSFIDPENASSLYYVATKKALRRFNYIFLYEGQEEADTGNGGKARKDKLLGHFKDFMEKLSNKQNLYRNLLPKNYNLRRVLNNRTKEAAFTIHKNEEDQFRKFRSELHGTIWGGNPGDSKHRHGNAKKEEILRYQNKEPGDVTAYGIKTIDDAPKHEENVNENINKKDPIILEKSHFPEHSKRLTDMKLKMYPKLEEIMGNKYEKIIKKKDVKLPPLGRVPEHEIKHVKMEMPDLSSMIEKRVDRLKKQYKYIGDDYKDYLLNKLTNSISGKEKERSVSVSGGAGKKSQAYKFLM